jgi:hypothetical protein
MALGGMTVGEMEARMGYGEFLRWSRFEAQEPFLPFRIDLVGGLICSVLANVNRGKTVPSFDALDFMPFMKRSSENAEIEQRKAGMPEPVDEVEAGLQLAVLRLGGRVVK